MYARFTAQIGKVLLGIVLGGIVFSCGSAALAEQPALPAPDRHYTVNTISLPDGMVVDEGVINGPPAPPPGFEAERQAVLLPEPDSAGSTRTLTVPGFNWVFGCSAVSGAMIAGYYDRNGYPNMYTGPTNGGVMPLDNSSWPTWSDGSTTYPNCPLIASKNGVDGRTTKGSIDDYWVQYNSSTSDPYITGGWTQHAWSDAIGDYMKTSQSAYSNTDGSTTFYTWTSSASQLTCADMVTNNIHTRDGTYGRKLFYEARGYTVTDCYNQKTDNTISGGFSFAQFKAEIDAGRPVMLNLAGHTIVGVGYDDTGQTVYIHDTWDYNNHTMTWGGSYSGMTLQSVSIVNLAPRVSTVSFSSITPPSPKPVGTGITFTATASGGAAPVQYQFYLKPPGGAWTVKQAYSASSTWNWSTAGLAPGVYTIQVWAKSAGSTAAYEAYNTTSFTLTSSVTAVSFSSITPSSPRPAGTSIAFTAAATGGTAPIQYQFWLKPPGGAWTVKQAYSSASTWTWNTTGMAGGAYSVQVWAKSAGSTASYEAYNTTTYTITSTSNVTAVSFSSITPPSPKPVGTSVTFTAAATGGTAPVQYLFYLKPPGGAWTVKQAYSSASTWTWNTAGQAVGTYSVQVWAKSAGSTAAYEAYNSTSYTLTNSVTAVNFSSITPSSPRPVGTSVTFTAAATGGTAPVQYLFYLKPPGGAWTVKQAYSPASSWTWNTTGLASGTYSVQVWAKSAGSTAAYEAYNTTSYILTSPTGGFSTHFTSTDGWEAHNGAWSINSGTYYYTPGVASMWSTASYNGGTFTNVDYTATMYRGGGAADTYANTLLVRFSPSAGFDSTLQPNSTYMFEYSNSGYYSVWRKAGDATTPLQSWTSSSYISETGWNTLRVVASGSNFTFYINGNQVWSGTDTTLLSGRVGLMQYNNPSFFGVDTAALTIPSAGSMMGESISPEQSRLNAEALARGAQGQSASHAPR